MATGRYLQPLKYYSTTLQYNLSAFIFATTYSILLLQNSLVLL